MPEKFNAARRVRNILSTARARNEHDNTLSAWGTTFQILDVPNYQFETFRLLKLLTEQVDNLTIEVEGFGLDQSDYQVTFDHLQNTLNVTNLDASWSNHKRYITDEVIRQLGLFSQMSPVDEQVVSAEQLENLRQDLDAFLAEVMGNVTDDRLRAFVVKQIRIILQGIREYPIRGEDAIRDGDATLLATFLSNHDVIREHKGEEVVEKTMGFWERWTKLLPWGNFGISVARLLMDVDVDPQKAIEAGSKAIEAGSDVLDKLP